MALAFGARHPLYAGLAVATIGVTGGTRSRVPLADIRLGRLRPRRARCDRSARRRPDDGNHERVLRRVGEARRVACARGSAAGVVRGRCAPQRPEAAARGDRADLGRAARRARRRHQQHRDLVRATSACFIAVYVLAIGSAIRILVGRIRIAAYLALILTSRSVCSPRSTSRCLRSSSRGRCSCDAAYGSRTTIRSPRSARSTTTRPRRGRAPDAEPVEHAARPTQSAVTSSREPVSSPRRS